MQYMLNAGNAQGPRAKIAHGQSQVTLKSQKEDMLAPQL